MVTDNECLRINRTAAELQMSFQQNNENITCAFIEYNASLHCSLSFRKLKWS